MRLFLFIILLPALAAIGHDGYLFYENQPEEGFRLASLGFIWTTYHLESYKQAVEMLEPDVWAYINEILAFPAVYVALALAAFLGILGGLVYMIFGGDKRERAPKRRFKSLPKDRLRRKSQGSGNAFQYKRKD